MKNPDQPTVQQSLYLLPSISEIIDKTQLKTALFLNSEITLMYWKIGTHINENLEQNSNSKYGKQIVATLSQQLMKTYGKGYSYSALTRMCKVASTVKEEIIATLSQQLSWSHLIELSQINDIQKREFYTFMSIQGNWGVRRLREQTEKMLFERTSLAKQTELEIKSQLSQLTEQNILHPDIVFKNTYVLEFLNLSSSHSESDLEKALVTNMEQFILELGSGFAFLERQKRISVDGEDYHLDLLFYHRKLKRLVAIDLKLGKFKPSYKGQMELYLRWLERYEMQENEGKPIGLLLCSEGKSEHIELLMLNESDIKVAQYLTELPNKQWFADKLHRAVEIAKQANPINTKNL